MLSPLHIGSYSNEILEKEIRLFDQWYLKKHLKIKLSSNTFKSLLNSMKKSSQIWKIKQGFYPQGLHVKKLDV